MDSCACVYLQGGRLLHGEITSGSTHALSKAGTSSSTDAVTAVTVTVTFTRDKDNIATTSKKLWVETAEDHVAEAPQLSSQPAASSKASESQGILAPAFAIMTSGNLATVDSAQPPAVTRSAPSSPAAPAAAPSPAWKRMCHPPSICSRVVDEEGYSKEDCRPQRPTPAGFGNLCEEDIGTAFTVIGYVVIVAIIVVCICDCHWASSKA